MKQSCSQFEKLVEWVAYKTEQISLCASFLPQIPRRSFSLFSKPSLLVLWHLSSFPHFYVFPSFFLKAARFMAGSEEWKKGLFIKVPRRRGHIFYNLNKFIFCKIKATVSARMRWVLRVMCMGRLEMCTKF